WVLILTPARGGYPSEGYRVAQTAGWIDARLLEASHGLPYRIEVGGGELRIVEAATGKVVGSHIVGVGRASAPSPTGTGYLQGRFVDESQGLGPWPILLTSLHGTTSDVAYGDGAL